MSLDPQTRALLDRAKHGFEPSAQDARDAEAALLAAIGVAAIGATAGVAAGAAGASVSAGKLVSGGSVFAKVIVGLAVVSAGIAGVAALARPVAPTSAEVPAALATPASTAPSTATAATGPTREPIADPSPLAARSVPATRLAVPAAAAGLPATTSTADAPRPAGPDAVGPPAAIAPESEPMIARAPASTLEDEVAIVRDGTARLHAGDGAGALAAFDAHARSYPRGVLEEERSAGRVLALCALGRVAEARAQRDVLRAEHPASAHAARIRESCAGAW
jgi:hypothetical protein